ncbi:MAG: hypothetical protein HDR13_00725 [Lachnospiraceae bacterium]|nr:hypothetical protein [Lachnospiraceae bacterium]
MQNVIITLNNLGITLLNNLPFVLFFLANTILTTIVSVRFNKKKNVFIKEIHISLFKTSIKFSETNNIPKKKN